MPHGNHKAKTYSIYTKDKEKGIKADIKSSHKGRWQEGRKEQRNYKKQNKTTHKTVR